MTRSKPSEVNISTEKLTPLFVDADGKGIPGKNAQSISIDMPKNEIPTQPLRMMPGILNGSDELELHSFKTSGSRLSSKTVSSLFPSNLPPSGSTGITYSSLGLPNIVHANDDQPQTTSNSYPLQSPLDSANPGCNSQRGIPDPQSLATSCISAKVDKASTCASPSCPNGLDGLIGDGETPPSRVTITGTDGMPAPPLIKKVVIAESLNRTQQIVNRTQVLNEEGLMFTELNCCFVCYGHHKIFHKFFWLLARLRLIRQNWCLLWLFVMALTVVTLYINGYAIQTPHVLQAGFFFMILPNFVCTSPIDAAQHMALVRLLMATLSCIVPLVIYFAFYSVNDPTPWLLLSSAIYLLFVLDVLCSPSDHVYTSAGLDASKTYRKLQRKWYIQMKRKGKVDRPNCIAPTASGTLTSTDSRATSALLKEWITLNSNRMKLCTRPHYVAFHVYAYHRYIGWRLANLVLVAFMLFALATLLWLKAPLDNGQEDMMDAPIFFEGLSHSLSVSTNDCTPPFKVPIVNTAFPLRHCADDLQITLENITVGHEIYGNSLEVSLCGPASTHLDYGVWHTFPVILRCNRHNIPTASKCRYFSICISADYQPCKVSEKPSAVCDVVYPRQLSVRVPIILLIITSHLCIGAIFMMVWLWARRC